MQSCWTSDGSRLLLLLLLKLLQATPVVLLPHS
jgi:hypothetical protein